jgi:O-antigen/teichoic acid export membrane protein
VRLILVVPVVLLLAGPVGYFVAEPLCQLLYGAEYRPAGLTLTVLFIGIPFAVLAAALGAILQAQGEEQFVAKVGIGFAVTFVTAIGFGGHLYGSVGAAVGGCTAMALNCVPLVVGVLRLQDSPRLAELSELGGAELTPTRASAD